MAYRQPGVTVTQEFLNALPALAPFALPSVIVGPVFQVQDRQDSGAYAASLVTVAYANQIAGSVVDLRASDSTDLLDYPVRIFIDNAVVKLLGPNATGAVPSGLLNTFTDATGSVFANVQTGDVIVVTGSGFGGNNGSFTVRSKTDNNTLVTNETFQAAETSMSYTIRRNVGEIEIPTDFTGVVVASGGVTIPAVLTTVLTTPAGTFTVLSGTILLTYRALRLEKSADVFEYTTTASLQADFGIDQIVPESPAVFGAYLALNNSATPINLLALPADYLTDEGIAYSKAFDVLALTDMYAIAVMTQNPAVATSLKSHVTTYSQPELKLERVGITNRKIVLTAVVVDTKADGVTNAGGTTLTSATSQFITDGVVPGHFVTITLPTPQAGRYEIASVDSQTKVTLSDAVPGGVVTSISFQVDKDLTKNEQASTIAAYAASLGSRRLVLTWPDQVKIPVGNQIRTLPGFFLNACVVALTTGLPTQQGLTNLSVSVYSGVIHSSKYFSDAQMNLMADGGVMIFVQDVLDVTAPYIRHQLTTDRSAVKFQEYSVTKNVDYIAKFIRSNHKQFPGQYNIVDGTFDDLRSNASRILTYLKDKTSLPKIGGVIRGGTLVSIIQDPVNIDAIAERYSLNIPIPLNNLDITIVV